MSELISRMYVLWSLSAQALTPTLSQWERETGICSKSRIYEHWSGQVSSCRLNGFPSRGSTLLSSFRNKDSRRRDLPHSGYPATLFDEFNQHVRKFR